MQDLIETIKHVLRKKRDIEAEVHVHEMALRSGQHPWHQERCDHLRECLLLIDSWMLLLRADQEFVVRRHLMDGLPWNKLTAEYERLWPEYAKSERSLIRIQKDALVRMVEFSELHMATIEHLFKKGM